jgi:hypothetical protein
MEKTSAHGDLEIRVGGERKLFVRCGPIKLVDLPQRLYCHLLTALSVFEKQFDGQAKRSIRNFATAPALLLTVQIRCNGQTPEPALDRRSRPFSNGYCLATSPSLGPCPFVFTRLTL